VPFCHVTTTVPRSKDQDLPKRLGFVGAPKVAFLDAAGRVLLEVTPGPAGHTVERFAEVAAETKELLSLREKTAAGDARAGAGLLILELEHRLVPLVTGLLRRGSLRDETPAEKKRLDELLLNLAIGEEIVAAGADRARRRELGRRYWKLLQSGAGAGAEVTRGYWFVIGEYADEERDLAAGEAAYEGLSRNLEKAAPGAAWATRLLDERRTAVEKLRQKAK